MLFFLAAKSLSCFITCNYSKVHLDHCAVKAVGALHGSRPSHGGRASPLVQDVLRINQVLLRYLFYFQFWFQIWTLCSSDGALLSCEPYCGNSTKIPKVLNNQGPDVVLGLVAKANVSKGSKVFFDNLFTSMPLLDILSNKGEKLFSVDLLFIIQRRRQA